MSSRVLVVDDEIDVREGLTKLLARSGFDVTGEASAEAALELAKEVDFDIVVSDIRLPGPTNGIELMRRMTERSPDTSFIMMTGFANVQTAIEALRLGAYDYIQKPTKPEEIVRRVSHVARYREARLEIQRLRQQMHLSADAHNIIGASPQMRRVLQVVQKVASTPSTVLVTGESGTGKELIARAIHYSGSRGAEPFVPIDCAAIPDTLLESELFGHVKGSFTGADRDKEGLFVVARGGTLFLDEIGEVPLHLQVKLLRAIEEKQVMPIGGEQLVPVSARIIAATNRDLAHQVERGRFRSDLFYRLNVVELHLPPLRERRSDIPTLVNHFVRRFNVELKRHFTGADSAAMRALINYSWKGNVRELENVIERAMILSDNATITLDDLPQNITGEAAIVADHEGEEDDLALATRAFEERHIRKILHGVGYDTHRACTGLGISRSTFFDKLRRLGISLRQASAEHEDDEDLSLAVQAFQERHIRRVLRKADYDAREACALLGISRSTLFEKTRSYGISLKEKVRRPGL